jgi:mRNA interferase RelE/StbE
MADYKVSFKASVDKDLANLPKNVVARVWQRFELLKQEPFPRQALKLEGSEGLHRLRVGDYRIV